MDRRPPRLSELIALGVAGGIVPWPAALTAILFVLRHGEKLGFSLLLLACFSVGSGAVLVAIGTLVVTGSHLAYGPRQAAPRSPFLNRVAAPFAAVTPLVRALFVAALGAYLIASRACP